MKRVSIFLILMVFISGCSGASAPGTEKSGCDQGICLHLTVAEPVNFNEPALLTITVTSEKDQKIGVTLAATNSVILEDVREKNISAPEVQDNGVMGWIVDQIEPNKPITFSITAYLQKEGIYYIMAYATVATVPPIRVYDKITISYEASGSKAFMSGTPVDLPYGIAYPFTGTPPTPVPTVTRQPTLSPAIISSTPEPVEKSTAYPPPGSSTPDQSKVLESITPTLPAYPGATR